ncbi:NAD(P)-binding protein [Parathielavia hyrcaniae]|uniref:NAD(P)-binding protein n=1 Tax=Parathielavia hyrcaniae TaxID=113614 RepID=A0AAN6T4Y3_9PEZI|nr:NAD(P)-binding protein [Parathielavia hyrcaniae]
MKHRASQPAMMRIAIAGAGGFSQILAQQISQTAHALLVLSRRPRPELEEYCPGCQVAVVTYDDVENLRYTLQGVDLVISAIAGNEQLNLIDAARRARVRVFVPSEFEGDLAHRPAQDDDPLDRGSQSALQLLESWSQPSSKAQQQQHHHHHHHRLRYTVFSCGVFMERFGPGGLQAYGIGAGCGVQGPDDYLVNVQEARAEIIPVGPGGGGSARPVKISMTSVYDVAQFVTAALDLGLDSWPREFRMRGDTVTAQELVEACSAAVGLPFGLVVRHYHEVEAQAEACRQRGDWAQWLYFQRLLQTANGRYHVRQPNLNEAIPQVQPLTFRSWLEHVWGNAAAV